jgi:hypothetical protein
MDQIIKIVYNKLELLLADKKFKYAEETTRKLFQ